MKSLKYNVSLPLGPMHKNVVWIYVVKSPGKSTAKDLVTAYCQELLTPGDGSRDGSRDQSLAHTESGILGLLVHDTNIEGFGG